MFEPTAAMTRRHAIASPSGEATESQWMTGTVPANILLLKGPPRFDWIQVRRIGRQVEKTDAAHRARRGDARVVVGGQVIHDEYVVRAKLREKNALYPANESLFVGRGKHRREGDPTGQADRSEDGQVLSPVHGNTVDEFAAPLYPCVRAAHREVHAGFVDENELVSGDAPYAAQELPAFFLDIGPQTLQRPAAFFLTTYP
jgi:hypothetical protein